MTPRHDGRADDELRPVVITRGFTSHPAGSVLITFGETRNSSTSRSDRIPVSVKRSRCESRCLVTFFTVREPSAIAIASALATWRIVIHVFAPVSTASRVPSAT